MITTGIALVFILKRKVQEHRQWMTRSFAVRELVLGVEMLFTQADNGVRLGECSSFLTAATRTKFFGPKDQEANRR